MCRLNRHELIVDVVSIEYAQFFSVRSFRQCLQIIWTCKHVGMKRNCHASQVDSCMCASFSVISISVDLRHQEEIICELFDVDVYSQISFADYDYVRIISSR